MDKKTKAKNILSPELYFTLSCGYSTTTITTTTTTTMNVLNSIKKSSNNVSSMILSIVNLRKDTL